MLGNISSKPAFAKIVIRVLNHGKSDDVLEFDPDMESTGFNVVFQQNTVNTKTKLWMEYDGVVPYLDAFFRSLNMDSDSTTCAEVQIDLPGMPSVLLKKRDLLAYLFSVMEDHLAALQESDVWPMESTASA